MKQSIMVENHPASKSFSFSLLTVEWLLALGTIFLVLAKHWQLFVGEKGGPYSLVVLITVGSMLTWQWADVWQTRQKVQGESISTETLNAVQGSFFSLVRSSRY